MKHTKLNKPIIEANRELLATIGDCSGDMARLCLRLSVTTERLEQAVYELRKTDPYIVANMESDPRGIVCQLTAPL